MGKSHKQLVKEKILEYVLKYKDKKASDIAQIFYDEQKDKLKLTGRLDSYRRRISNYLSKENGNKIIADSDIINIMKAHDENVKKIIQILSQEYHSVKSISEKLRLPANYIEYIIDKLKQEKYNISENGRGYYYLDKITKVGNVIKINALRKNKYKFGVVSDNHLNSIHERLDVLNALYDIFQEEGVEIVLNAGNWIEGEAKFNRYEIKNHGIDKQVSYFVDNYPQREGIITKFIAGDDHEGWYWQREGINIGEYAQLKAEQSGRKDLQYIGYVESDIILQTKKGGKTIIKVMHAGGGTAYALSYSPQKIIESFQGGGKPQILILGHYHKAEYIMYRNVHTIQAGCTQDQTTFMRKKRISAHLGGWIIEFSTSDDGAVHEFVPRFYSFFNESYYKRMNYYQLRGENGK